MKEFGVMVLIYLFLFGTFSYAGKQKKYNINQLQKVKPKIRYRYFKRGDYVGEGKFRMKHGKGIRTYVDKSVYDGVYKMNKKHGKGKFTFSDGDKYEGDWLKGKYHGKGKFTFSDGGEYEGDWVKGEHHGKGIFTFSNGNKYEGEFVKDKYHGKGIFTFSDGDKYEGEFVKGEHHGKGIFTFSNGDKYKGDWIKGEHHGKGKFTFADGSKYEGDWIKSRYHGKGELTLSNGGEYKGEFVKGRYHGKGKLTLSSGDEYEGKYKKDRTVGLTSLVIVEKVSNSHGNTKKVKHHITYKKGQYYYQKNKDGKKQKIDMKNEKRLEVLLFQFGHADINSESTKTHTPKSFREEINRLISASRTSPKITIMGIPGHVFPVLSENGKVYIFDSGGLFLTKYKDYSHVIDKRDDIGYLRIQSENTLSFGLQGENKRVKIRLNTIDPDEYCCRHKASVIYSKLHELKSNLKKGDSIHASFIRYLKDSRSDETLKMEPNSPRGIRKKGTF